MSGRPPALVLPDPAYLARQRRKNEFKSGIAKTPLAGVLTFPSGVGSAVKDPSPSANGNIGHPSPSANGNIGHPSPSANGNIGQQRCKTQHSPPPRPASYKQPDTFILPAPTTPSPRALPAPAPMPAPAPAPRLSKQKSSMSSVPSSEDAAREAATQIFDDFLRAGLVPKSSPRSQGSSTPPGKGREAIEPADLAAKVLRCEKAAAADAAAEAALAADAAAADAAAADVAATAEAVAASPSAVEAAKPALPTTAEPASSAHAPAAAAAAPALVADNQVSPPLSPPGDGGTQVLHGSTLDLSPTSREIPPAPRPAPDVNGTKSQGGGARAGGMATTAPKTAVDEKQKRDMGPFKPKPNAPRDEAKRAMQAFVKGRRRIWRLTVLLLVLLLTWPAWTVANYKLIWNYTTRTYEPAVGVELEIGACDVDLIPGDIPGIEYAIRGVSNYKASWRSGGDGLDLISSGTISNPAGCGFLNTFESCRRKCLVTVQVPPEAAANASITLFQSATDKTSPLVRVWPDTVLHVLNAGRPARKPKTLSLFAEGATFSGALNTALGAGSVNVIRSTVSESSSIVADGPIFLQSVDAAKAPADCSTGTTAAGAFKSLKSTSGEMALTTPAFVGVQATKLAPKPPQLLASDAKRLKDQYGKIYGDRESTKQGYIIIDVVGLPYGTTPVRFIYATSPFFLVLDPGELYFLSGGLLSPDLVREMVHFTTFSCDANQQILPTRDDDRNTSKGLVLPNATTPLPNATLALMAAALTKALHSNPADDSLLRGELVLVDPRPLSGDPNGRPNLLWDSPTMLQFAPENPLANAELYENPGLCKLLQLALYLCTAFGLLVSFVATYAAYFMLRKMRMDAWKKDEAETIIVMKQMGYESATILADRASAGEDRAQPTNNPFVGPFVMLTKFIIDPIRKKQVDSIERFIRRRCTVTPAGASGRFIYMRDWARAYELFCLENKLRIETDRNLIQRELIDKYNCRVQQIRVDRLYGLRWRSGGEYGPMEAMNHANVDRDTPLVDVISGFISEMCIADGLPGDFIDFETRSGPDGSSQLGFRPALTKWCKEKGIETPAVSIGSKDLVSALPKDVKPRDQIPVRQIRGLEWLTITGDGGMSLSWSFYMMEALTVFVHMGLYLPSLLLIYYAMIVQQKWALNLAPPSSYVPPLWNEPPAGQPPLLLFDARSEGLHEVAGQIMPDCIIAFFVNFATTAKNRLMPYFDKDYVLEKYVPDDEMPGTEFTVVGTVKLVVGECAFFMAFTLVRQVLHYADAPP